MTFSVCDLTEKGGEARHFYLVVFDNKKSLFEVFFRIALVDWIWKGICSSSTSEFIVFLGDRITFTLSIFFKNRLRSH